MKVMENNTIKHSWKKNRTIGWIQKSVSAFSFRVRLTLDDREPFSVVDLWRGSIL